MSKIEDLQENVRSAIRNVDDIAVNLETAKEELDAIAIELEEAVENTKGLASPVVEPARVGDIVEILDATDGAAEHIGLWVPVVEIVARGPIVALPKKGQFSREYGVGSLPRWTLELNTYRVVARFVTDFPGSENRHYDYLGAN